MAGGGFAFFCVFFLLCLAAGSGRVMASVDAWMLGWTTGSIGCEWRWMDCLSLGNLIYSCILACPIVKGTIVVVVVCWLVLDVVSVGSLNKNRRAVNLSLWVLSSCSIVLFYDAIHSIPSYTFSYSRMVTI